MYSFTHMQMVVFFFTNVIMCFTCVKHIFISHMYKANEQLNLGFKTPVVYTFILIIGIHIRLTLIWVKFGHILQDR